jgi:hypothetical protein
MFNTIRRHLRAFLYAEETAIAKSAQNEEMLLRIALDASPTQDLVQRAKDIADELIGFRDGLAAGFGIYSADPFRTLVELGQAQLKHHREHHIRERKAWDMVLRLVNIELDADELASISMLAETKLEELDEQGMPQ